MAPPRKPKAVPDPPPQQQSVLTEEQQVRVLTLAASEMLAASAADPKVLALVRKYPDETTALFVAGCRAGSKAMAQVVKESVL